MKTQARRKMNRCEAIAMQIEHQIRGFRTMTLTIELSE